MRLAPSLGCWSAALLLGASLTGNPVSTAMTPPEPNTSVTQLTAYEALPALSVDEAATLARRNGFSSERFQFYYELASDAPFAVGQPIEDRAFWKCVLRTESALKALQIADSQADAEDIGFDEDLYLEFSRSGDRASYELFLVRKSQMLLALTIAECIHNDQNDLELLEGEIDEWLVMPTWVAPAHDKDLRCFEGKRALIDLASSVVGANLAIIAVWLENTLPPELVDEMRATVYQRTVEPYLADLRRGKWSNAWWANADHNWNAVCHAGVIGAALALPGHRAEKALLLTAAEHAMRTHYLPGFASDGFCREGLGYWNYGFGQYLAMSLLLRDYTDGNANWGVIPEVAGIAQFPAKYELHHGLYPTFSDCFPPNNKLQYSNARMAHDLLPTIIPEPSPNFESWEEADAYHGLGYRLSVLARNLSYRCNEDSPDATNATTGTPQLSQFEEAQVYVARDLESQATPFSIAISAGHNGANHNHNDVGSWVCAVGETMLLVDPGMDVYSAASFDHRRYDSPINNSYGHPVPVIDGQLQRSGEDARATVVSLVEDAGVFALTIDYRAAYQLPQLTQLERAFQLNRAQPERLVITDSFQANRPVTFETAVLTFSEYRIHKGELWVWSGVDIVRVNASSDAGEITVHSEHIDAGRQQPDRIAFRLEQPTQAGAVTLTVTPETQLPF
ncbi:heparinase II/III domain-containing protein [Cerasicoccus frondis]|uniref:heparinase II/III domain-containing protein n=1 Tax=Cerasicoccus frondis TaxID=490090 RepID=UPI0028525FDA|nr:heparinase II/III family protein [Cerasicoccus frondis]